MPQMILLQKRLKQTNVYRGAKLSPCSGLVALYLRLLHRGCVLVTHGANLHSTLPFPVTLLEELGHDAVSPLSIELQGLGGVAEVCTVHHVPEDLVRTGRDCPSKARLDLSLWGL